MGVDCHDTELSSANFQVSATLALVESASIQKEPDISSALLKQFVCLPTTLLVLPVAMTFYEPAGYSRNEESFQALVVQFSVTAVYASCQ